MRGMQYNLFSIRLKSHRDRMT